MTRMHTPTPSIPVSYAFVSRRVVFRLRSVALRVAGYWPYESSA